MNTGLGREGETKVDVWLFRMFCSNEEFNHRWWGN